MLLRAIVIATLCCVASSDNVYKKNCDGVDPSACRIVSVDVKNCRNAPRFCRVRSGKRYPLTVGYVPHFSAEKVVLSTGVDLQNDGNYVTMTSSKRVCEDHLIVCPLAAYIRESLEFDFTVNENFSGSRPARVHFWNADNATEACCFTFKVKSSWHPNQL